MYKKPILTFIYIFAMLAAPALADTPTVERWGVFDTAFSGPKSGNPFVDIQLSARFTHGNHTVNVNGFYDGDGTYRLHFMPDELGDWQYVTASNAPDLSGVHGSLTCITPSANNHGPVGVRNVRHLFYADGKPFVQIGTTCYGWVFEPESIEDETLATLKTSPFNKVRMMLLPGDSHPLFYPYARDSAGNFDQSRFNPDFFHHLEKRLQQLDDLNVEADLILFNPYHKGDMEWFDGLDDAADDRYIRYVVARLSAFRNVWWSLANEFGQVKHKTDSDWDHFFQVVQSDDPYGHMRSIHNAAHFYDYSKPWVTHASLQNGNAVADFGRAILYRDFVQKPIVYDEVCYEGNISSRWGRLTGEQMVERFWFGTIAGTYVGHGETFSKAGVAWTSGGGQLLGQSPPRLMFLRKILEAGPAEGIEPIDGYYETHIGGKSGEFYLIYFGEETPTQWTFSLPRDPPNRNALAQGMKFHADILDTWNMTITPVDRVFTIGTFANYKYPVDGDPVIKLPGKPYIAIRLQRVN